MGPAQVISRRAGRATLTYRVTGTLRFKRQRQRRSREATGNVFHSSWEGRVMKGRDEEPEMLIKLRGETQTANKTNRIWSLGGAQSPFYFLAARRSETIADVKPGCASARWMRRTRRFKTPRLKPSESSAGFPARHQIRSVLFLIQKRGRARFSRRKTKTLWGHLYFKSPGIKIKRCIWLQVHCKVTSAE